MDRETKLGGIEEARAGDAPLGWISSIAQSRLASNLAARQRGEIAASHQLHESAGTCKNCVGKKARVQPDEACYGMLPHSPAGLPELLPGLENRLEAE